MVKTIVFSILFCVTSVLVGCGVQNQDRAVPNQEFESTEQGIMPVRQPGDRTIDEQGESWDSKDQRTIKDAAERVPGVMVDEVTFNNEVVHVYVFVNRPKSEADRKSWESEIASAIEAEVPHYSIAVHVQ